jgi:uncharacterized protein (TIGR02453 family)
MIQKSTLGFLKKLKKNNNREWFNTNKHMYDEARQDFEIFVDALILTVSDFDSACAGLEPKKCIFRIYRDVRFSKNKSPYKINFGAVLRHGGRKSVNKSDYYFHLQPGNESFAGGGLFQPDNTLLKKVRRKIADDFDEWQEIIKNKEFKKHFKSFWNEDALKRVPAGYDADHPAAEFLKLKHFIVWKDLTDEEVTSQKLVDKCDRIYRAIYPMLEFLNKA